MPIDDSRRPEPAAPQPGPMPSIDGLSGSEVGRPPHPGEVGTDGDDRQRAEDVEVEPDGP